MKKTKEQRTRHALIRKIGSAAFCDNGAMIVHADIASALDADRGAGFADPTPDEVEQMVFGAVLAAPIDPSWDGSPPPEIRAKHPALDALLTREMT